jgi:hypothetical protein
MRLGEGRRLRHHNVCVNINRGRRRPARQTIGVMDSGGGAAIAILAVDHFSNLCWIDV